MADDLTWLIWSLGLVTGLLFASIPVFLWLRNYRKRDHVWAIVRHHDGIWRAHDVGKPDEGGAVHTKTFTGLFQSGTDMFKAFMQSPRPCCLYEEGDPNPININVEFIREKGADGKDHFYKLTSPRREPMPGYVFGRAIDTHIVKEALGTQNMALLLAVAAIGMFVFGIVFGKVMG